ncbi:MAG: Fe-S cluster assembly protein SufD [Xanthomonadaceae bacterium]|jgi:Fe-S cluster assembly protein SufD|nr:Fe-S cluster assembly protein SufD [Xanthomonadaceae bacterium]
MNPLLESFATAFDVDPARRPQLDDAIRDGLPGSRDEAWKYTSLRALERRGFTPAREIPALDPSLLADIPSPRMVFVNGLYSDALSDLSTLPKGIELVQLSQQLAGRDASPREGLPQRTTHPHTVLQRRFMHAREVFARLNGALANEGVLLYVGNEVRAGRPLHLVFIAGEDTTDRAWHHRHLFDIRHEASLTLLEHHISVGDAPHLGNTVVHVHLKQGATLRHARIQNHAAAMVSLLRTDAVLASDSHYQRLDLELGAKLTRHELNVRLEGDNARLQANGVLLGNALRHVDTRLSIEHIARNTACELSWRGVAGDRSRVVFHGGIHIRQSAGGSDANLSNKNLLLSADAEVDTQPVLEIDADEVKAAHGATVGQLDPTALFYLRSRGIPEAQAQQLLTAAFCREPLAIGGEAIAEALTRQLDGSLEKAGMA